MMIDENISENHYLKVLNFSVVVLYFVFLININCQLNHNENDWKIGDEK